MVQPELAFERFAHDDRVFMNKYPKTRQERHASRDKESKERALLEKRPPIRGQRYINYGKHIASADHGTVGHISEQDRFFTDFAAEEKKRRDDAYVVKQEQLSRRRHNLVAAEEQRWGQLEKEWAYYEAKQEARSQRGVPRNQCSVPYNPLTLQYEDSPDGEMLKYSDEQIKYRAALRAERLRGHQSKNGYNPITGEHQAGIKLPPNPKPPSF